MKLQFLIDHIDSKIADAGGIPRNASREPRRHLGASVIGKECVRQTFYGWRWATDVKFGGRMMRLFQRGHDEENRFIEVLAVAGITVNNIDPATGKQYRFIGYKGHFGGSGDGIATGVQGLQEYGVTPEDRLIAEFKTHGEKSFKKLVEEGGVRKAKPEHYVQMQVYMQSMSLIGGLYCAINKNTDEMWIEFVPFSPIVAADAQLVAKTIVDLRQIPPRIHYASVSNFKCRYCDFRPQCLMGAPLQKNCRTCKFSVAVEEGRWACEKWNMLIPEKEEIKGCPQWETIT